MNTELFALIGLGFTLGARHAIDWDHIAAITDFISAEGNKRKGFFLSLSKPQQRLWYWRPPRHRRRNCYPNFVIYHRRRRGYISARAYCRAGFYCRIVRLSTTSSYHLIDRL